MKTICSRAKMWNFLVSYYFGCFGWRKWFENVWKRLIRDDLYPSSSDCNVLFKIAEVVKNALAASLKMAENWKWRFFESGAEVYNLVETQQFSKNRKTSHSQLAAYKNQSHNTKIEAQNDPRNSEAFCPTPCIQV